MAPLTYSNDGGGGARGPSDLAKSYFLASVKDARIFLGHKKKTEGFFGCEKRTKRFFGLC